MFEIITLHPVFVHFTVALLLIAAISLSLGKVTNLSYKDTIFKIGYLSLWGGTIITIPTVIAGFYEYATVAHDTPSHIAMKSHRNWAIATFISFSILALWSAIGKHKEPNALFVGLIVCASILLTNTGHKGSLLVYKYGIRVQSLPSQDNHNHASHDDKMENKNIDNHHDHSNDDHHH